MDTQALEGCRVLIVEDEYVLAVELRIELSKAGATIIGPIGRLQQAVEIVEAEEQIDGAVLDVNLRGEAVFPVADLLVARGIPIIFVTGYDSASLPPRFAEIVTCVKPCAMSTVIEAVAQSMRG